MAVVSMSYLLEAGVHFGHQTKRWNPKMKEYIFTSRDDIYIIDLEKTASCIESAYAEIKKIAENGGNFLFVGTKKQANEAAKEEAGGGGDAPKSKTKMWISGLILIGVVLCMALNLKTVPLHTAAVTGAILCVITGCLKEKEAYAGIDWVTIFLFAGMLSVASAMEKTGAGKMIADTVVSMMGSNPNPYVLTGVLFLISNVLTQFMSNTASAALLAPIGISIAQSIGADPKPVLMALGIAASCAFATPMATPPNTLVLGPGNFSFNDYAKVGVPMCVISLIVCLIVIPIVWPFGM